VQHRLAGRKRDLGGDEAERLGQKRIRSKGLFSLFFFDVPVVAFFFFDFSIFSLRLSTSTTAAPLFFNTLNFPPHKTADLAAGMEHLRLNPDAQEFVPPSLGASSSGFQQQQQQQQHRPQSYAMMVSGSGAAAAAAAASSSSTSSSNGNGNASSAPSNGNGGGASSHRASNGGGAATAGFYHNQQHFGGGGGNGNGNGSFHHHHGHGHHLHGNGASTSGHHHLYPGGFHGNGPQQHQHHQQDFGPYRRVKGDARAKAVQRKKNSVQKALEEAGAVQRTVSSFSFLLALRSFFVSSERG